MNLHDDETRDLLREESRPDACPPSETLVLAVTGQIKRPPRDKFIDHLLTCEDCAREVRLLADLDSRLDSLLAPMASEKAAARDSRRPRLRPAWAAALLLVLAAAAVSFFLVRSGSLPADDALRGEDASAVVFLNPENALPPAPAPAEFRWSPVPGASLYSFEILTSELESVFSADPEPGTSRTLPPGVRRGLSAGRAYFAWVKAFDPSGKTIAEGMRMFRPE